MSEIERLKDENKVLKYLAQSNEVAHKQQEKIINRLRKAAKAFQDINFCYRVGKSPSMKTLDECEKGRKLLNELNAIEKQNENHGVEDYPANDGGLY